MGKLKHSDQVEMKSQQTGMPIEVEDRFVVFIDILCFRDLIRRMTDGEWVLFETIKKTLESILNNEKSTYEHKEWQIQPSSTRQMTAFSDCVVISDIRKNLFGVLLAAKSLYIRLLFGGILCRGGIARGPTYHSGRIVFGQGLILAHELESQAAVYPRIIVADEVKETLDAKDAQSRLNIKSSSILAQDNDGIWFIDPFARPRTWEPSMEVQVLTKMREKIIDGLTRAQKRNPPKLGQIGKHKWLAMRFNKALTAEEKSEPTRIEI